MHADPIDPVEEERSHEELPDEERAEEESLRGDDERIARKDTGFRAVATLLMAVIWGLVEAVLAVVVIFSIIFSLILQQPPPVRLREFANRLVAYGYRLWRYMTYNESHVPFPFSEFPDEIEPPADLGRDEASELRALLDARRDPPG